MDFLDDKICPFCHGDNQCQVDQPTACWCFETKVPKSLIDLLPDALRNKACICKNCVEAYQADSKLFEENYLAGQ